LYRIAYDNSLKGDKSDLFAVLLSTEGTCGRSKEEKSIQSPFLGATDCYFFSDKKKGSIDGLKNRWTMIETPAASLRHFYSSEGQ
jgi:hypothetical protein